MENIALMLLWSYWEYMCGVMGSFCLIVSCVRNFRYIGAHCSRKQWPNLRKYWKSIDSSEANMINKYLLQSISKALDNMENTLDDTKQHLFAANFLRIDDPFFVCRCKCC